MTGLDLSPASLAQARELSRRAGPDVEFVEAELYDAVSVLGAVLLATPAVSLLGGREPARSTALGDGCARSGGRSRS